MLRLGGGGPILSIEVDHFTVSKSNLTYEVPKIGRFLPFAAPSFKGGVDIPRVTADGLTTAHFEYSLLSQRYSFHSDSLYWTYENRLMGDPIGPNGTSYELQIGR